MGRSAPYAARQTTIQTETDVSIPASTILAHCAIEERRVLLGVLAENDERELSTLARHVTARRRDEPVTEVSTAAVDSLAVSLYHNHLQKLSEARLVDVTDGDDVTVSLAQRVDHDRVHNLIERGAGEWGSLSAILSEPRRERVTSLLVSADDTLSLENLARAVTALERGEAGKPPEPSVESTRVSLHHVHLPKLEDVGVVEYDAESGRISLQDLPAAYEAVFEHATDRSID